MSVDYRLLDRFTASRKRHEAARRALPAHWRSDERPEAQIINEHWVSVMARAAEEQSGPRSADTPLALPDDR